MRSLPHRAFVICVSLKLGSVPNLCLRRDALEPARRADFVAAYLDEIKRNYGARHDGRMLLPFPRVFILAAR